MFEATRMMYFYVETPLHAGTGRAMGAVDLPIQREKVTGYPMVQSSSIKGRLRAEASQPGKLPEAEVFAIFGPNTENASDHAGALAPGDAKLLLLPVRSLAGVFAWTTSVEVLARFDRDIQMLGAAPAFKMPPVPASSAALVNGNELIAGGKVVLEEYALAPDQTQAAAVQAIGAWLAANALPQTAEYAYWRDMLPKRLAILDNNSFRDFAQFGTEVQTHVQLDEKTKTVINGALWTEESLPADTLLYAPLCATPSRNSVKLDGAGVLQKITDLKITRMQLGGDETTGRGIVSVRI
jgi:CRISPR-associated protein Cmr4